MFGRFDFPKRSETTKREPEPIRGIAGFSLMEILVVLAIMAMIASFVGPRLFSQVDKSKITVAEAQIQSIETALETLRLDIGRYPTEEEGLAILDVEPDELSARSAWFGPYMRSGVPMDPWGREYKYSPPESDSRGFDKVPYVYSYGEDGSLGGEGLSVDLGRLPGS